MSVNESKPHRSSFSVYSLGHITPPPLSMIQYHTTHQNFLVYSRVKVVPLNLPSLYQMLQQHDFDNVYRLPHWSSMMIPMAPTQPQRTYVPHSSIISPSSRVQRKKRTHYDFNFKRKAVQVFIHAKRKNTQTTMTAVASRLDISMSNLSNWIRQSQ